MHILALFGGNFINVRAFIVIRKAWLETYLRYIANRIFIIVFLLLNHQIFRYWWILVKRKNVLRHLSYTCSLPQLREGRSTNLHYLCHLNSSSCFCIPPSSSFFSPLGVLQVKNNLQMQAHRLKAKRSLKRR